MAIISKNKSNFLARQETGGGAHLRYLWRYGVSYYTSPRIPRVHSWECQVTLSMILLPHCRVNVKFHLFTTEEGGRENDIADWYRADHALSDDGVLTMGQLYFLNKEQETLNTGESADMQVVFIISHNSKPKVVNLKKGDKWKVFEGKRCVGECEMIERVSTDEEMNNQIHVTW